MRYPLFSAGERTRHHLWSYMESPRRRGGVISNRKFTKHYYIFYSFWAKRNENIPVSHVLFILSNANPIPFHAELSFAFSSSPGEVEEGGGDLYWICTAPPSPLLSLPTDANAALKGRHLMLRMDKERPILLQPPFASWSKCRIRMLGRRKT